MRERNKLLLMLAVFAGCYYMPVEALPFRNPLFEAIALVRWYARKHVLLCLVPAFFIAGAISVFVSQASVIKYFGAKANKFLAYSVAAVCQGQYGGSGPALCCRCFRGYIREGPGWVLPRHFFTLAPP